RRTFIAITATAAQWRRTSHCTERGDAAFQFLVELVEAVGAVQLIGGNPKTGEDASQQKCEPQHESPADGFGEHGQGNIQQPTSHIEHPMNARLARSMLGVARWRLNVFILYSMQ